MTFQGLVWSEIQKTKGIRRRVRDPHEALCEVIREFGEVKAEVVKSQPNGANMGLLRELIHMAALCECIAADLDLVTPENLIDVLGGPVEARPQ